MNNPCPWFAPKYNTMTFAQVWPSQKAFLDDCSENLAFYVEPNTAVTQNGLKTLYFLLYAKYGNTPIINEDVNQFKFKIYSLIFTYGPAWEKKVAIQKKILEWAESDIIVGAKQIYNHAANPGTSPATGDLEELSYINDQSTATHKKGLPEAYGILWEMIHTAHTEEFLNKFKDCFSKFVGVVPVPFYIDDVNIIPEEVEEDD